MPQSQLDPIVRTYVCFAEQMSRGMCGRIFRQDAVFCRLSTKTDEDLKIDGIARDLSPDPSKLNLQQRLDS